MSDLTTPRQVAEEPRPPAWRSYVRSVLGTLLLTSRFLPVWLATIALLIVSAIIAPEALQSTSWAFVLPYMTVLAVAALGQMLVIMQAGIDLWLSGDRGIPRSFPFGGDLAAVRDSHIIFVVGRLAP